MMSANVKFAAADDCVEATEICYNYNSELHALLENQVNLELKASYFYQIYGNYFDRSDVALPGFTEYFLRESLHEHTHADNLLRYINQRGGKTVFKSINITDICDNVENIAFCEYIIFNNFMDNENKTKKIGLWALRDALSIERVVMESLTYIVISSKNDSQLSHYIEHEYLDEQVQTMKRLGSFIGQLNMLSDNDYFVGQYIFDKDLFKKVKKTVKTNREDKQNSRIGSHFQWLEEREGDDDPLYI